VLALLELAHCFTARQQARHRRHAQLIKPHAFVSPELAACSFGWWLMAGADLF
jgi:hypothetical protein